MSRFTVVLAVILTALMAIPTIASAKEPSWKHKNKVLRHRVTKLFGSDAPGCNLVAKKCKGKKATQPKVHKYFNTMRAMLMPKPAARYVIAGKPYQAPANTRTVNAGGTLEAIAKCESGGNPSTNTGNGFYGKYQFTQSTWQSVGGSGNPAAASEAEQNKRAAMLYAREGAGPWPVCGR